MVRGFLTVCIAVCDVTFVSPDLWAAGISSDEEEEIQPGPGSHDLDLLASLVEKREVEGGGGGEGGDTGRRLNTIDSREKTATFEESLTTPNEVSLMKGKLVYYNIALFQGAPSLFCIHKGTYV